MSIRAPNIQIPRPSQGRDVRSLSERGVRDEALNGRDVSKKHTRRRRLDPYDVMAAVSRLLELLDSDFKNGIPDDIPSRGYYLNILV